MKKLILIVTLILVMTGSVFAEDFDRLKIEDEIFTSFEHFARVESMHNQYSRTPQRPINPYRIPMLLARRNLQILLNHYKLRYKEVFDYKLKYKEWLQTVPPYPNYKD